MIVGHYARKALILFSGVLVAAFLFNSAVSAQSKGVWVPHGKTSMQGSGILAESPSPGAGHPTSPILRLGSDEALLFSPYSHLFLTHQNKIQKYVDLFDPDAAFINGGTGDPYPFLQGVEYNLYTLNGMDVYFQNGGGPDGTGEEACMAFSVRQDQLIITPSGNQVYVHTSDIAELDLDTGEVNILFQGAPFNLHGIDAVSVMHGDGGSSLTFDEGIIFSPDGDFFYDFKGQQILFHDEDLACFDFNSKEISLFLRGWDLGISSLDAVDVMMMEKPLNSDGYQVYFSVRKPIFIYNPPNVLYLKDGDVACYEEETGKIEKVLEGTPFHIYNLDALSITDAQPE